MITKRKRPNPKIFFPVTLLLLALVRSQEDTTDTTTTTSTGSTGDAAESVCGLGCIRCNPVINACEICDHKNGYVLDSKKKSCEESSDSNCILYGRDIRK